MERLSPIWWARSLGFAALAVVVGIGLYHGESWKSIVERAPWAMLGAAMAGLFLGRVVYQALDMVEAPPETESPPQFAAELPGTMPPAE